MLRYKKCFVCIFAVGFTLIAVFLSGCGTKEPIRQTGFYFDTVISVTLYDRTKTEELAHCFELADRYEHYFSAKIKDSDISKINDAAGSPVAVHEETLALLEKGLDYARLSQGKFDITIGKLTGLWDFQAESPVVPQPSALKKAVANVDYHKVVIKGNEVTLQNPQSAIDLGGIAKGYIADQMKEYLLSQGVTEGIINLGGNILTIGTKENGDAYTIGIQKPFDETGAPIVSLQVKDQSVVTSGTYERYFEQDGVLYHHILDTENGYPYDNGLVSVSVISKKSVDGDGLSTTCFALGLEKGMELIESQPHTEAIFITSDFELHCTSGIGKEIPMQKVENP